MDSVRYRFARSNTPTYLRTLSRHHRARLRLMRAEQSIDRPWDRLRSLHLDQALAAWESIEASGVGQ